MNQKKTKQSIICLDRDIVFNSAHNLTQAILLVVWYQGHFDHVLLFGLFFFILSSINFEGHLNSKKKYIHKKRIYGKCGITLA